MQRHFPQPPHLTDEREQRPAVRLSSVLSSQAFDLCELGFCEGLHRAVHYA